MQIAIQLLERYLGPKAAAAFTSLGVAHVQITERLAESGGGDSYLGVVQQALESGSLASLIPAPVAGLAAFLLRKTKKDVEEVHYDAQGNVVKRAKAPKPPSFKESVNGAIGELDNRIREIDRGQKRVGAFYDKIVGMEKSIDELNDYNKKRFITLERENETLMQTVQSTSRTVEMLQLRQNPETYQAPDVNHDNNASNKKVPLNVRNNNPGNIRPTAEGKTRWKGESDSTNAYAYFADPVMGARAMLYLLRRSYFTRRGLNTVEKIINRWSPYNDPGNSTAAVDNYKKYVAEKIGVQINEVLDLNDKDVLVAMAIAMAHYEGGKPFPFAVTTWYESEKLI